MQLCICLDFFHNYLEICLFAQLENKQKVIINEILLRISVCIGKNHCINVLLLFSHPVMSNSWQLMDCPSPSPGICPSSCSLHWWCHPAISSSVALFCYCPQSFSAAGNFPMSHLFASVSQFGHSVMTDSLWPHGLQASLPFTNSWSLLKLLSIESVMLSNHLNLCHPLLLLPSVFPSIRVLIKLNSKRFLKLKIHVDFFFFLKRALCFLLLFT